MGRRLRPWAVAALLAYCAAAASSSPHHGPNTAGIERCLGEELSGRVIFPSDVSYSKVKQCANRRSELEPYPLAVVRVKTVLDVQHAVRCAVMHRVQVCAKGGGYGVENTAGCTGGVALDMSGLGEISIDESSAVVRFGAGVPSGRLYETLAASNLVLPLGDDGSLGATGLALGCGHGTLVGLFGLACESLLQVEYIDGTGELQVAGLANWKGNEPVQQATWVGCYANEGPDRIGGHHRNISASGCAALAATEYVPMFALEFPEGSDEPGKADCLTFAGLPDMRKAPDSDCEVEVFSGLRLGGGNRLAVYVQPQIPFPQRTEWVEYVGCFATDDNQTTFPEMRPGKLASFRECKEKAARSSAAYIGLQNPLDDDHAKKKAECLLLEELPTPLPAGLEDGSCDGDLLGKGIRLGGPQRLAIYRLRTQGTSTLPPFITSTLTTTTRTTTRTTTTATTSTTETTTTTATTSTSTRTSSSTTRSTTSSRTTTTTTRTSTSRTSTTRTSTTRTATTTATRHAAEAATDSTVSDLRKLWKYAASKRRLLGGPAAAQYAGCFLQQAHLPPGATPRWGLTPAQCAALAQTEAEAYFGLAGHGGGGCLTFQGLPALVAAPDGDCAVSATLELPREGSKGRMALYSVPDPQEGGIRHLLHDDSLDVLWMARGAGGEFPGIVVRTYMQARPLPRRMDSQRCHLVLKSVAAAKPVIKDWVSFGKHFMERKVATKLTLQGNPPTLEATMHCIGCTAQQLEWAHWAFNAILGDLPKRCDGLQKNRTWLEHLETQSQWDVPDVLCPKASEPCSSPWGRGEVISKHGSHLSFSWNISDEVVDELVHLVLEKAPGGPGAVSAAFHHLARPNTINEGAASQAARAAWSVHYRHVWMPFDNHAMREPMMTHHALLSRALDRHLPCAGMYSYLDDEKTCVSSPAEWLEAYFQNVPRMSAVKWVSDPFNVFRSRLPGSREVVAIDPRRDGTWRAANVPAVFDPKVPGFLRVEHVGCFWGYGSTGPLSPKGGTGHHRKDAPKDAPAHLSVVKCKQACEEDLECHGFVKPDTRDSADKRCWLAKDVHLPMCLKDAPYSTYVIEPYIEHKNRACYHGAGGDMLPGTNPLDGVETIAACRAACSANRECQGFVKLPGVRHRYCWLVTNISLKHCVQGVPYSTYERVAELPEAKWSLADYRADPPRRRVEAALAILAVGVAGALAAVQLVLRRRSSGQKARSLVNHCRTARDDEPVSMEEMSLLRRATV